MERNIAKIPGVEKAELNFGASRLVVEGIADAERIAAEARKDGVAATVEGDTPVQKISLLEKHRRVLITAVSAAFLLAGWLAGLAQGRGGLSLALYLLAAIAGAYSNAAKAVRSMARLEFNMNVLMTVAVTGAFLIGQWSEGAVVAFLFSASEALESYSIERARRSVCALMEVAPKMATVRQAGGEFEIPVDQVRVGDLLIVRPGEKIPLDGRVAGGGSAVDQSAVTGESVPVDKTEGDGVFAGTINQHGFLEVEVTRQSNDTTIARVIRLVEEAQAKKAPVQAFVDRFARYYTPAVIALAAGITIVPPLYGGYPWGPWIYRGLTLLVVACPCALVVSTPVAMVTAIGNAARNGLLIKGGIYLEQAARLSVVAFDKTGTLTRGVPSVTDMAPAGGVAPRELLRLAAGVEKLSAHPLAKALVKKAEEEGLVPDGRVEDFKSLTGRGVIGKLEGKEILVGAPGLFEEHGFDLANWVEQVSALAGQGKTVTLVGVEKEIAGLIALADTPRPGSGDILRRLRESGVKRIVMLTGDNRQTAGAIAGAVGADAYLAGLMPEDKVEAVREIQEQYGTVAMVGDGVNDAPALAAASLGIAMGGAGSDAALETADIVLMGDDLGRLPFAVLLSRAASRVIKQNIGFALAIKLAAVLLVFPGWLTLWLAIAADMGASLLVTLNGLRLLAVRPE